MNYDLETIPSAWTGHRGFAQWLVQKLQPRITVELGVDFGYSTFVLAENNPGHVYGIDTFTGDAHAGHRDQEQYIKVENFRSNNGFNNVTLIKDTFDNANTKWTQLIDLLHLDGLHTAEAVTHDLLNWSKFFHNKTVVLMHDVSSFDDIEQVFMKIPQPKVRFLHSGGLGVLCADAQIILDVKQHWKDDAFYEYEILESNPSWPRIRERYFDNRNVRYTTP